MRPHTCGTCSHMEKVENGRRCFDAHPCEERPALWPWLRPFDICDHYQRKEEPKTIVRGATPE